MVEIHYNVIFLSNSYFIWGNSVSGFIWFWSTFGELMFCFLLYLSCLPTYSSLSVKIWDHTIKMRVSICNTVWFCYFPVLWRTSWSDKFFLSEHERTSFWVIACLKVLGCFLDFWGLNFVSSFKEFVESVRSYVSQSVNAGGYLQFPVNSLMHTEKTKASIKACFEFKPVLNLLIAGLVAGLSLSAFLFIYYVPYARHCYLFAWVSQCSLPVAVSSASRWGCWLGSSDSWVPMNPASVFYELFAPPICPLRGGNLS